jgi:hypothetical protein
MQKSRRTDPPEAESAVILVVEETGAIFEVGLSSALSMWSFIDADRDGLDCPEDDDEVMGITCSLFFEESLENGTEFTGAFPPPLLLHITVKHDVPQRTFYHIPFSGLEPMAEVFRRRVIRMLVERELQNTEFAIKRLVWKRSEIQHRQYGPDLGSRGAGESVRVRLAPADLAEEDPLRAIQATSLVPHEVFEVRQRRRTYVRRPRLPG